MGFSIDFLPHLQSYFSFFLPSLLVLPQCLTRDVGNYATRKVVATHLPVHPGLYVLYVWNCPTKHALLFCNGDALSRTSKIFSTMYGTVRQSLWPWCTFLYIHDSSTKCVTVTRFSLHPNPSDKGYVELSDKAREGDAPDVLSRTSKTDSVFWLSWWVVYWTLALIILVIAIRSNRNEMFSSQSSLFYYVFGSQSSYSF